MPGTGISAGKHRRQTRTVSSLKGHQERGDYTPLGLMQVLQYRDKASSTTWVIEARGTFPEVMLTRKTFQRWARAVGRERGSGERTKLRLHQRLGQENVL